MYSTLTHIKEYLEDCFSPERARTVFVDKEKIVLAPIEKEGQGEGEDIVITLLRIEEETSRKQQSPFRYAVDERDGKKKVVSKNVNPDVCLNLYVLITSHAQKYDTALAQISDVIYWMNNINYEDASNEISANSLQVELQSLTSEQHNSMWQTLGGKMVPSVVYKVRMVTIAAAESTEKVVPVKDIFLTRDSGPWSSALAKLHAGGELTEAEKALLRQKMVEMYANPVDLLENHPDIKEYPFFWERRKAQLEQWKKEEPWNADDVGREEYNDRVASIKKIQWECLIEALKAIRAKDPSKRTDVEKEALRIALTDIELKKEI
ncbi:MAG: DUF4255 domain-containing protein [Paludibacteraceae bacterium]|nr:DUF4255 domain-containing protein [Paludibacteraceae bacterium]